MWILFPMLIVVPGVLIPLYVISRMYAVVADERRAASEKLFARGTMVAMLVLMGGSMYAALKVFALLKALSAPELGP